MLDDFYSCSPEWASANSSVYVCVFVFMKLLVSRCVQVLVKARENIFLKTKSETSKLLKCCDLMTVEIFKKSNYLFNTLLMLNMRSVLIQLRRQETDQNIFSWLETGDDFLWNVPHFRKHDKPELIFPFTCGSDQIGSGRVGWINDEIKKWKTQQTQQKY